MLLITHAITGAALATIQKSIPAAFAIGLVSHYLLDMIPHYDHNVAPLLAKNDKAGIRKTLALIALDDAKPGFGIAAPAKHAVATTAPAKTAGK